MGRESRVVDLHGMDRESALARLRDAFEASRRDGVKRLLVVHGKGGGVLRLMVWEFLEDHPSVSAIQFAKPRDGGEGATEVWIRNDGGRWRA